MSQPPVRRWLRRFDCFVIWKNGLVYMRRYFLAGNHKDDDSHNVYGLRLHQILLSDNDRFLHDHPWDFVSIGLWGSYREETPEGTRTYRAPWIVQRRAEHAHKLTLLTPGVWTLVIVGRRRREWGFHTDSGWVPWDQYLDSIDQAAVA